MNKTHTFYEILCGKKQNPRKKNVAKNLSLLQYPDSKRRVENEPYSDSYQIRDFELEHDFWAILNFLTILSLVILVKRILLKKKW